MADIAGAVAGFLALLGNCIQPIKRQLNYLCCFSSNSQDFGGEKKKLVDVKEGLQMRVTTARDNAEIIFPEVETWLKDADKIQEKIIGIESEITNIQGGSRLAVRSRYSLSKKIKKTTEVMKELRDKCKFDPNHPISESAPPPARVPLPLGSTTDFESRRQIEDDIMTCLKAGKVNMLGICGMGGVGKTTMAKRVINKAREHNLFDEIVIAVVSQPADMSKVQNEIAESLGMKLEDETLIARAHKLRIRLIGGKRILIVLDDIWMSLNLEDLGIPRESGSKGCTILLTSRDRDVLNEMGAQQITGIQTLSNEEAWSLFREKVGVCADDPNLRSIALEIVDKCEGLPIAIVNVAAALKDKNDKDIWDDALQDMPKVLEDVYNLHDFRDEVKKLDYAKDVLQMRVNAARNNAEKIFPIVETWLKDADEIQEKIIGIESEITNIQGRGCLAVKSHFLLSKKVKRTTEDMKELRDNCKFNLISEHAPPPAMEPLPLGPTTDFESRRQIEDDIMTCLKAEKVNMLGICGMGGVGKTTMAKRVINKAREHNLFDEILIAVVSQPADMSKVQNEIVESLGMKLEDVTLSARAHKLRIRLMGVKRILIVLDDVWKSLNLEELGIPLESGSKGCTILLTSRDRDVLNEMGAQQIIGIQTLSNEEAWSLFREKVGVCADDANLFSIAQEIVDECKGLPIAIVNVAAALKDKNDKRNWRHARQQLRSGNPVDMPKVLEDVYKPLKLSYDFLGIQNAQYIFLLCCLFPEDFRIRVEDLIAYVWGLRMFEGNMDLEEVRNMTYSLVQMLKSRFLLLEGYHQVEDYVRMHDVVRDVAIFIASKEKQLIKCGAHSTWLSPSLGQRMEEISNGVIFLNLRLLMTDESFSDISFEGMRDLNVLSMRSVRSLPCTTQLLKSLRTLILDSRSLKSISGIGELVDLEVLICHYTWINKLPAEMSRLVRLMKLEISNCSKFTTIAPNIISSLVALKEFKMENGFKGWEVNEGGRKNASLSELECLSSLTCLSIQIADPTLAAQHMVLPLHQIVKYDIVIGKVHVLMCLPYHRREFEKTMLMCLPGEITSLGNWVLECISRVEYLFLEGAGSNIVDLGQTQKMRKLIFRDCSTTRKLVNISIGSTTVFPHLVYLELKNLANLEDIYQSPKGSAINAFKNLKEVLLERLPMMKHLWGNNSTYHDCLQQLEKLEISTCKIMEQVFLWNEEEEMEVIFPKLETLILRDLPMLTSFSKGIGRIEFSQLTNVTINNCPHLRSLVSIPNNSGGINHLHQEKVKFGMLKNLEMVNTRSNNTSKLWFYQIPPNSFTELERLCIRNFGNIRSLFSSSTARNLGNLTILQIHDCEEMVIVIENEESGETSGIVFPRLQQLEMWGLDKLQMFCKYHLELPSLKDMDILGCYSMERFSLGSLTTPNLEAFSVSGFRYFTINTGQDLNIALHQPLIKAKEEDCFYNWVLNQNSEGMERISELALFLRTDKGRSRPLKIKADYAMAAQQMNFPSDTIVRYDVTIGHMVSQRYSYLSQCNRLMRLHLPISDEITLGNWVHQCVRSVEYMQLEGDLGPNKVDFPQPQNMRQLTLANSSTLTKLVNILATLSVDDDGRNSSCTATTTCVFPHLECVDLVSLPNLEEIYPRDDDNSVPASIMNNVLNNLRKLHLRNLPAIKHLWKSNNANSCLLQQLQQLIIMRCPMMEQVFLWEKQGSETGPKITMTFPELKSLALWNLPRLTSLCKGIERIEFSQLTLLEIRNCPQLKSLLPSGNHDNQKSDDGSLHLFCQPQKVAFGELEKLCMRGNESISNSSSLWCDQIPTHDFFTGLVRLRIGEFSKLRSLFSSSIASNLNNLRELYVIGCEEMVKVIEDDAASCEMSTIRLFPLLQYLVLGNLPKLEIFCEWRSCVDVELPSLQTVEIDDCPKMERFNLGSLITPNLERIKTDGNNDFDTKDLNVSLQLQVSRVEVNLNKSTLELTLRCFQKRAAITFCTSAEKVQEEEN